MMNPAKQMTSPHFDYNNSLFHYTSIDVVQKILRNDNIHFHMTKLEDFNDKTEGKCVDEFFYEALTRLYDNSIISNYEKEQLHGIKPLGKHVFIDDSGCSPIARYTEFDTFVLCFSLKNNDEYMFGEYIKSDDKKGFCLEFMNPMFEMNTKNARNNNILLEMKKALYGVDAVDYLYSYVYSLFERYKRCDRDRMKKWIIPQVRLKLHDMRFMCKAEEYRKEEEVRLIAYRSIRNHNSESIVDCFESIMVDGKEKIDMTLNKCMLCNLLPSKAVETEESNTIVLKLRNSGYMI